jgi:hypothetical protein
MIFIKLLRLSLLFVLLAVLLTGCRQPTATPNPESDIQITVTVSPDPPQTGEATLTVHVTRNGAPVLDGKLNIRGDMNHAGMVPVLREDIPLENGVAAVPFEWTMGGGWFVEVSVTLPDGETAVQRFDFSVTT